MKAKEWAGYHNWCMLADDPNYIFFSSCPGLPDPQVIFFFLPQVSLGFSPSQQLPGADVELQLQAAPGSLCAVRAVDEGVSLLRPERELSNHSVSSLLMGGKRELAGKTI